MKNRRKTVAEKRRNISNLEAEAMEARTKRIRSGAKG